MNVTCRNILNRSKSVKGLKRSNKSPNRINDPESFLNEFKALPDKFLDSPRYYLERIPHSKMRVIKTIVEQYSNTGLVNMSQQTMADRSGCSVRHVCYLLSELKAEGFIITEYTHRRPCVYLPHPIFNKTKMRDSLKGLFKYMYMIPFVITMLLSQGSQLHAEYLRPSNPKLNIKNTINLTYSRKEEDFGSTGGVVNEDLSVTGRREEFSMPGERQIVKVDLTMTKALYAKNTAPRKAAEDEERFLRFLRRDTLFRVDRKKVLNALGIELKKKKIQKGDSVSIFSDDERKLMSKPKVYESKKASNVPYYAPYVPVEVKPSEKQVYEEYFYFEDHANKLFPVANPYTGRLNEILDITLLTSKYTREELMCGLRRIYDAQKP